MGGKQNKRESFLQEKLGLETDETTIERAHTIGKKEEGKRRSIIEKVAWESVKQIQGAEIMGGSNLNKWRLQWVYTVEKRRILFKFAKEIRERDKFAKVVYNRLVSY